MKWFLLFIIWLSIPAIAQQSRNYSLPKFAPSYHRTTRDIGPRPDSHSLAGKENTTFKRIYAEPAALRLLVRTRCGSRPGDKALLDRAKTISDERGNPVQIDWETIRTDKVSFYAVIQSRRKIVSMDLSTVEGKYQAGETKTSDREHWEIRQLSLGTSNKTCINEKDMQNKELRLAIENILNNLTLQNYRRPSNE